MSQDEPVIYISLRDVFDAVQSLEKKVESRLDSHEADDTRRFDSLNGKVYGILATVVAAAVAVVVNISGVHIP
jgi:hypothetical protein